MDDRMTTQDPFDEAMAWLEEKQLLARAAKCKELGHEWHTCPACCDRACLRCGLPDQAWNEDVQGWNR